jgi:glycosyltransferase involved in cell wall biosynthesis
MNFNDFENDDTIALCMVVKNEEQNIERCLKSVAGIIDELVIVDTGSTDNTLKLAEKHGPKVFNYEWDGDFSKARNLGLQNAKSDWILVLDADEEIEESSRDKLHEAIQYENGIAVFVYIIDSLNGMKWQTLQPRLFRNHKGIEYKNPVAENIFPSIDRLVKVQNKTFRDYEIYINHFSSESPEDHIAKITRNTEMLEKVLCDATITDHEKIYFLFKLIQSYRLLPTDPAKIVSLITHTFELLQQSQYKEAPYETTTLAINIFIIDYLLQLSKTDLAAQIIENALKFYPNSLNLLQLMFHIELKKGNKDKAIDALIKSKVFIDNKSYIKYELLLLDQIINNVNGYLREFENQGYNIASMIENSSNKPEKKVLLSEVLEFNYFEPEEE